MVEIVRLVGLGAVQQYSRPLARLAERISAPAPLLWEALCAWCTPRPERELITLLVREGDTVTGAAHLTRQLRYGVWRYAKAGSPGEPFLLLAATADAAHRLAVAIQDELAASGRRWELRLADLPAGDSTATALAALLAPAQVELQQVTPQMFFSPEAGLNAYLTRNTRAAVAKARNRIARENRSLAVGWSHTPASVVAELDDVVRVRRSRDEQLHRARHDEREEQTFRDTVTGLARAGHVRLLSVRIDGELAAFAVGFQTSGTLWVYANAVSPSFTHFSAGTIANAEVVRWAHAEPSIRVLNWGAGVQRYKLSGRTEITTTQVIRAWSSRRIKVWSEIRAIARAALVGGR